MDDGHNGTIVFVLGAGCSQDCGAPVMRDFMRVAANRRFSVAEELKKHYEELFAFRRRCLSISYVFNRWWENLEDLFTQVHLQSLLDPAADPVRESIQRVIWDVYRRSSTRGDESGGYASLANYLIRLANWARKFNGPRPVVVTRTSFITASG